MPAMLNIQLQVPFRLICVGCNVEMPAKPNETFVVCPKCGVKVRLETAQMNPMGADRTILPPKLAPKDLERVNRIIPKVNWKRPPPAA